MGGRVSRSGFALVELLVALALAVTLAAGWLGLYRSQARVVGTQALRADLQQAMRLAEHELALRTRMAGRGGLPGSSAIEVWDDVPTGTRIGSAYSAKVAPGSDLLILRGVFEGEIYELAGAPTIDGPSGEVSIARTNGAGEEQALEVLAADARREPGGALLLTDLSGSDVCRVVELVSAEEIEPSGGLRLRFRTSGSPAVSIYSELCPPEVPIERLDGLGILQEVRYYIRVDPTGPSRLTRAWYRPGSDVPSVGSPRDGQDLLDYARDLQVALGADLDGDGLIADEAPGVDDEWWFEEPDDVPDTDALAPRRARITLLLQAARAESGYLAPSPGEIENRRYAEWDALPVVDRRLRMARTTFSVERR